MTSPDHETKEHAVFNHASLLSGAELEEYLAQVGSNDPELLARVRARLGASAKAVDPSEAETMRRTSSVSPRVDDTAAAGAWQSLLRKQFGPYKVLDILGEGGMGIVYLAEQSTPVRRRVALKIIKLGMDTEHVIARFESERQALAMMDHPNVAKVFDAGATDIETAGGRPYFVMEYVQGIPINEYCDRNRLGTKERLSLFLPVCQAIQHAHQKGIIHRDIKPTNVLVSLVDGQPLVKVIDFGIAKATSRPLTERTLFTEMGQLIGTPEYMSPEQADMTGLNVDTRTDVYSLGVLLYELLAGTLPFDAVELRRAGFAEIQRTIREVEPPRPSVRLSSLGLDGTGAVARARSTTAAAIVRELRGDLDWITMMAMHKDRTRRYATPSDLAADIKRYLRHDPVVARPPTVAYQLRLFARKHRASFAAAAAVAVVLVLATVVSLVFANEARLSRDAERAARLESDRQRDAARHQAYIANIAAADASWQANAIPDAKRRLDRAPPELRNWEWHHLSSVADESVETVSNLGSAVAALGYRDGGEFVSVGLDSSIRVFDAATGAERKTLRREPADLHAVAISADGALVAWSLADFTIRIYSLHTGEAVLALPGHETSPSSLAFSPDGARLASGDDNGQIRVWDAVTGREIARRQTHEDGVDALAFHPDGDRLVSGSRDRTIRIWSAANDTEQVLRGHDDGVSSLAFNADGSRFASGASDRTIGVWDASTSRRLLTLRGHGAPVDTLAFSPDGSRVLSGSRDRSIRVWNADTGDAIATLRGHGGFLTCVRYSPDGAQIASGARGPTSDSPENSIKLWHARTKDESRTLRGHEGAVTAICESPDGRHFASASDDGTIRIWSAMTGETLSTSKGADGPIGTVAFSPDGRFLASAVGGVHCEPAAVEIVIRNARTSEVLRTLPGHPAPIDVVVFSPDGSTLASGGHDGTVRIWNVATGAEIHALMGHASFAASIAFSPDGTRLASGSLKDATITLWDTRTGRSIASVVGHDDWLYCLAYSPDGEVLASGGGDFVIKTWTGATLAPLFALEGQDEGIQAISFSPDGTRLASGSEDGTIKLWDTASPVEVATLRGHENWVTALVFTADGTRIASASKDRTIRIWDREAWPARYEALLTARRATAEARGIVERLFARGLAPDEVASLIEADRGVSEPVRSAGLDLALQRSAAATGRTTAPP